MGRTPYDGTGHTRNLKDLQVHAFDSQVLVRLARLYGLASLQGGPTLKKFHP